VALKDNTIRRVGIVFLAIVAVLVVVAVESLKSISRSVASNDWVNHTHSVILETEDIRSALVEGDGALHKYLLTGDARDLRASREQLSNVADSLEIAKALTRNEPIQNEQVIQVESLVSQRSDYVQKVIEARQADDSATVRSMLSADAGSTVIGEIERRLKKLKDQELELLTERDTASYLQAQATRWIVWAGMALDFVLLAGAGWIIRDDLAFRRRANAALQEANVGLEARVTERTSELMSANALLSTENLERQWANQALEHQLRYNHLIIDSISDLVLVLTKALNISRVNPAVVHLTGLEPVELINQSLSRIVRLTDDEEGGPATLRDPIAQALKDGRDLRDQPATVEDKHGRKTRVSFSIFPLRDRDKVVGGVVTLHVDKPKKQAMSN
jgi:PAS domain S-box-containing protein